MSLNIKVVKNYAGSLFAEAKKKSKEIEVFEDIKLFAGVLKNSKKSYNILCSPITDKCAKNNIVRSFVEALKLDELVARTLYIFIKNARMNLFFEVIKEYEHLMMEANGIRSVAVVFAAKPNQKEIEFIHNIVEAKLGTKIKLEHSVDESLIGGAVIKYESNLLDCSLRGALDRIQKTARHT